MNVLFYSPGNGKRCEKLQREIEAVVAADELEIYRTKSALSKRLRKPKYNLVAGVLHTPTKKAFSDICSLHDLLDGLRMILILPDRKRDTIAKAHQLRPRFVSYVDENPTFVISVLNKMLSNSHLSEYQE